MNVRHMRPRHKWWLLGLGVILVPVISLLLYRTIVAVEFPYYPEYCSIHHTEIVHELVRNTGYAYPDLHPGYSEDLSSARQGFPYSGINENCLGNPNSWVCWIDRKYCPTCRAEESKWSNQWYNEFCLSRRGKQQAAP